jgi:hypothetical protein
MPRPVTFEDFAHLDSAPFSPYGHDADGMIEIPKLWTEPSTDEEWAEVLK